MFLQVTMESLSIMIQGYFEEIVALNVTEKTIEIKAIDFGQGKGDQYY